MAVTYSTAIKTLRMTATRDGIDAGVGNGSIEIGTTAMALVLATIPLAATCGTVSNGVLAFTMPQSDLSANAAGNADAAQIKNGDGVVVVTGLTVGIAADVPVPDIIMGDTYIAEGQEVKLELASITHA